MNTSTVIIVNYKVAKLTCGCLDSLESEVARNPGTHVIVVDNDSQDGSAEEISAYIETKNWKDWATCVPSDKNGGFAYGNNLGIAHAKSIGWDSPLYWLLNPDTFAYENALSELKSFLDNNKNVGICGSAIYNADKSLWPYCFRFPGVLSEFERGISLGFVSKLLSRWKVPREMAQENAKVDWLPGASFMIRKEVFDDIGLMDDDYFLYYEETDFCLNALRNNWECWYVPSSTVLHIAGASTGVVDEKVGSKPLPEYLFNSRRRYFLKNHGFLYALCADLAWIIGYSLFLVKTRLTKRNASLTKDLLKDSLKHCVLFKRI